MSDFNHACHKCPRTFKLQEFYEKHKKVHELKKQHVCDICGFVYGAAKGLEGHYKTHSEEEVSAAAARKLPLPPRQPGSVEAAAAAAAAAAIAAASAAPGPPPFLNFVNLNRCGVLADAKPPPPSSVAAPAPPAPPTKPARRTSEKALSFDLEAAEAKATVAGGTGSYEIYGKIPQHLVDCAQNDRGFYSCGICHREFSGLNSLRKHIPIHTRRVQHRCDLCGHVFGKREYLLDHVRSHTGEISPVCAVCKQTFQKSLKLKEHMKLHKNLNVDGSVHDVLPYRCHLCREVFQLAAVLGNHLATAHPSEVNAAAAALVEVKAKNNAHVASKHMQQQQSESRNSSSPAAGSVRNKSVWCPVCNQGFTRQYNLKVHMSKTHGKEYVENNFSPNDKKDVQPSNGQQPPQQQHYFDSKKNTQVLPCQFCESTFVRKNDLVIHLENVHHLPMHLVTGSQPVPEDDDDDDMEDVDGIPAITINPVVAANKRKSSSDSEGSDSKRARRPGPASRTGRGQVGSSNIPLHLLEAQLEDESPNGYKCPECDKVLLHKQSYLSHLKVIHGNFFGSNKWKGSSVVDFILEQSRSPKKGGKGGRGGGPDANAAQCTLCEAVFPNPSSLRNHVVNVHVNGSSHTCQLCGKAFLNQENLDAHTKSKHPNLTKRLQALREALGIEEGTGFDGILQPPDINANTLPSNTILSLCQASLSLSAMSESPNESSPNVTVSNEFPLNLSTTSSKDSPTSSSYPSTLISLTHPKPAASSSVTVLQPSVASAKVDLPSAPVPAKDLADVAKLPPPPPPPLPSSPLPIGDIIVQVNNNNEGEGGDEDDDAESESGGGRKKNSICKVCGIVLSPKTNVNVHMRTHSGARPYQCALCLSRFRQKAHLMKHFRCSHNMKRPPFVCLFCPEETATSNDLYRHITDRHKADTDELVRAKGIQAPPEADEVDEHLQPIKPSRAQQQMLQKQAQLVSANAAAVAIAEAAAEAAEVIPEFPSLTTMQPIQPASPQEAAEVDIPQQVILPQQPLPMVQPTQPMEVTQPEQPAAAEASPQSSSEDDDDVRYEPITEPFLFEGQVIYPCYCILPYMTDGEVESSCRRSITAYYGNGNEAEEDAEEDGELQIDESRVDDEEEEIPEPRDHAADLKAILQRAEANNSSSYNAEDIKTDDAAGGFYPTSNMADFALPFSLSGMWKKKADVLPPETLHQLEMMRRAEEIKQQNAHVKENLATATAAKPKPASRKRRDAERAAAKAQQQEEAAEDKQRRSAAAAKEKIMAAEGNGNGSDSPSNNNAATSTEISEHENEVQNDHWPVDCIKCNLSLDTLENFNQHMNDHWSDDKCCPVCGLLINSKRFNFKQHLKIHTGEKPFVCKICARSFRQKAHMVKHITTHRTMPGGGSNSTPEAIAAN